MNATWPIVRLGDIVDIQLGKMLSPVSKAGIRPIPYLRNANVQWARFDLDEVHSMDFSPAEEVKFQLRPGDILVCEGGEPGRAAIWSGEIERCCYQKALHRLRPARDLVDAEFVLHRLRLGAIRNEFVQNQTKTTIAHLPAVRLAELRIGLPPLTEQRWIAAAVSLQMGEATRLRDRLEGIRVEVQRLGNSLRRSFMDTIPGERIALGAVVSGPGAIVDGPFGSNLKGDHYKSSGVRVIRLGNIGVGRFIDVDQAFVTPDHAATLQGHTAKPGDVVIAALGDGARPAGRACIVPSDLTTSLVKADCFRVRTDNSPLDPNFLMHVMNAPQTLELVRSTTRGATRPRMNLTMLKSLPIPLPAVDEQRQLSATLDGQLARIDSLVGSLSAKEEAIDALPAALLRRALGDLVA